MDFVSRPWTDLVVELFAVLSFALHQHAAACFRSCLGAAAMAANRLGRVGVVCGERGQYKGREGRRAVLVVVLLTKKMGPGLVLSDASAMLKLGDDYEKGPQDGHEDAEDGMKKAMKTSIIARGKRARLAVWRGAAANYGQRRSAVKR